MNRPAGVTASSVLLILGGLLCLVMGAVMTVALQVSPPPEVRQPGLPVKYLVFFVVGFFAAVAVWALATAAGLLRMRPWSRISVLLFAGMLVFFQVFGLLLVLFSFFTMQGLQAPAAGTVLAGFVVFYGTQILTGIWWLVYFNRRAVKDTFLAGTPAEEHPRPLSIAVIAWHLVVIGAISLLMVWPTWPAVFLGMWLEGWAAKAVYLLWGAASLYVGVGLLRLKPLALNQALAYVYAATVNAVLYWSMPDLAARTKEMMDRLGGPGARDPGIETFGPFMWPMYAIIFLLTFATPLWYLHTRKGKYLAAATARRR